MVVVKDMTFKAGQDMKISGKPKEATSFYINIGHNEDAIALHFNPRFDDNGDVNVIVCNSKHGDSWHEEHRESNFPFQPDEEFKVTISFNNEEFYVKLPNGNTMHFPNRFGDDKFKYVEFGGNAKLYGLKIK